MSMIESLFATIESRKTASGEASYTASLIQLGPAHCARKFGEESIELILAATSGDKAHIASEAADTIYHLLVLLAASGVTLDEVQSVLSARQSQSGHQEKASRKKR